MLLDCTVSAEGVGMLQSGDERGMMGFKVGEGVPLLMARPRGEDATLLGIALCLVA